MAISYTATGITITDDYGTRPPIVLPPTATAQEVDAAALPYHQPPLQPNWEAFFLWVGDYAPVSQAMRAARACDDPPGEPWTTGISSAQDEARLRGNFIPFRAAWGRILQAAAVAGLQIPPAAVVEIITKAAEYNLPAEFIDALDPS